VSMEKALMHVTRVSGVRMAAVCSYDGIAIASRAVAGTQGQDEIAAMSAEIGRGASLLLRAAGDELRAAVFDAASGKLVIGDMGRGYVVAIADPTANLALLRLEVETAADALRADLARTAARPLESPAGRAGPTA
jgi:predicted regulator of Ras-like GTPase activity (Roadblock/LC7/MglB family)